jgi:hypothetical protein
MLNKKELEKMSMKEIKCMFAIGLKGDDYKQIMTEYIERLKKERINQI